MRFIRQFGIILGICFIGEVMNAMIPLPVPASIYGLILMLFALKTKIIPLNQVKETSNFLIEIMPLMFIPAAVGLMISWEELKDILSPILLTTLVTTVIVMAVTGKTTQLIIRLETRKEK